MVALPPGEPPARVVAGVQVTWPLSKPETVLAPGTKLTVRVASKRRRARVAFVRVDESGRALRVVAARTLRRGSFTIKVPAAQGARYALRLNVAGKKRWSRVRTPAPVAPPVPAPLAAAAPTPAPTPASVSFCAEGEPPASAYSFELRLAANTVDAGDSLAYTITNTGQGSLLVAAQGTLVPDSAPPVFDRTGEQRLLAGASRTFTHTIAPGTAPGSYRIHHTITHAVCEVVNIAAMPSDPFVVLPG